MKKKKIFTIMLLFLLLYSVTIVSALEGKRSPWRPRFNRTDPELIERFEKQIENYSQVQPTLKGPHIGNVCCPDRIRFINVEFSIQ